MTAAFKRRRAAHPFFRSTFASRVDEQMRQLALSLPRTGGGFFTPSRAEQEAALQPIVDELLGVPRSLSEWWIRATHRGAGTMDALAISMYKEQRP